MLLVVGSSTWLCHPEKNPPSKKSRCWAAETQEPNLNTFSSSSLSLSPPVQPAHFQGQGPGGSGLGSICLWGSFPVWRHDRPTDQLTFFPPSIFLCEWVWVCHNLGIEKFSFWPTQDDLILASRLSYLFISLAATYLLSYILKLLPTRRRRRLKILIFFSPRLCWLFPFCCSLEQCEKKSHLHISSSEGVKKAWEEIFAPPSFRN